jgi:ethanolamine ammonia-lyase small subunit
MTTEQRSLDLPPREGRSAESGMLAQLRSLTPARIMLERSGDAVTTPVLLNFELAHARARDAVAASLDVDALAEALCAIGAPVNGAAALRVRSRAPGRAAYLARPDWGRRLAAESTALLAESTTAAAVVPDLVFVIADGLSAIAVQAHAPPLLQALMPLLPSHWNYGPPVIAFRLTSRDASFRPNAMVGASIIR